MEPAPRGPIALLAHQTRYELLTTCRNPRARFLTIIFPVLLLVIFAGVFHGTTTVSGVHVKLSRYFTAGILAMAIVLGSYANLVIVIATLRESGVLKRRRATPVPAAVLVGAQAISAVATVAIMSTVVLLVAKILYGIGLSTGAIAAVACTAVLGALTFAAIGYAVSGMVGSAEAAQPITQLTTMPLWFLSGVLIPTASLSGGLRTIGKIFPVEHLANGLHLASVHSTFSGSISGTDVLVLAAWGLAAAAFATWRFSWVPGNAAT
ncbi:MAG TPA: ABC transporter permease [Solirubrobacteraceae bacterium]|nr:ABC transporter permease [Solirubrobacteraceae bacterium]